MHPKIIQIPLKLILRRKAGIGQKAFFPVPLMQPTIVKHLHVIANNKGHNIVSQANKLKKVGMEAVICLAKERLPLTDDVWTMPVRLI